LATIHSGTDSTGILSAKACGAAYEKKARRYLEQQGLRFVATNVQMRGGEIDLIMADQQTIVFVEVRFRRNNHFGGAIASVTRLKQQRLLHAARIWLSQKNKSFDSVDCRFDVIAFTGNNVEWLTNAFASDF